MGCFQSDLLGELKPEIHLCLEKKVFLRAQTAHSHLCSASQTVLFTLPRVPLFLPGVFWVCNVSLHSHAGKTALQGCNYICNIHYLSAGTSSPLSEYPGFSVVPWMSWKLELIASCALSQVPPERLSCQVTSLLIDQTGPGNVLPHCQSAPWGCFDPWQFVLSQIKPGLGIAQAGGHSQRQFGCGESLLAGNSV